MADHKKSVPNCIRDLRQRQGVSQKDLARRLHINPMTLSRYERCIAPVPDVVIVRLLAALHCTFSELFLNVKTCGECAAEVARSAQRFSGPLCLVVLALCL